jgi:hypothetical protein
MSEGVKGNVIQLSDVLCLIRTEEKQELKGGSSIYLPIYGKRVNNLIGKEMNYFRIHQFVMFLKQF